MNTASPRKAVAVALIAATSLAPTLGAADPCDTRDANIEYLEPPFSAAQLRRAMPVGLKVVMQVDSPIAGKFTRQMAVEQSSAQTVSMRETTLEEAFRNAMPSGTVNASWEELRDHACFPAAQTKRSRITANTAFGELSAWRYQFDQDGVRLVLTFADALPGLPVSYERYESGILVLASEQSARSDRPKARPDPGA
ncbi:MAG: hypothetical protein AAGA68_13530 [Pseudomonadota bacterium]